MRRALVAIAVLAGLLLSSASSCSSARTDDYSNSSDSDYDRYDDDRYDDDRYDRNEYDKYGYELRVSVVAIADELAGAAELAGGKTANVPVVVIRGFEYTPAEGSAKSLIREAAGDMFR